jgi:site-specific DNA-methyltransferase (adenine-specific)
MNISDNIEIIDNSASLSDHWFQSSNHYSFEDIKQIPDNSVHLVIWDTSSIEIITDRTNLKLSENLEHFIEEFKRILVTGGRFVLLVDNFGRVNHSSNQFHPLHAYFVQKVNHAGFLMRGEAIWNTNPTYHHILVFSKASFKRKKEHQIDSISRDQFLSYTKSIWTPNPQILQDNSPSLLQNAALYTERLDLYAHIIHLYSFVEDVIVCNNENQTLDLAEFIRSIRKKSVILID